MKKALTTFAVMVLVGAMGSAASAQAPYNPDINRTEIVNFDHYLDAHPETARRLAANPGLVNNPQFIANHPGFQAFMANHPGVREEIHESPGQFLNREGHYEWNHGGAPVARFDNGYLDQHPEVAEQLGHDPRLVDNPQFLANHPGLDDYFKNHPEIREELQNHPDRFMAREHYYENHGERDGAHPLATTDHYMDSHPEVAQQLNKDPRLVDNRRYVDNHPGLHEYLQNHPVARHDWKSHPYRYMTAERHYDQKH